MNKHSMTERFDGAIANLDPFEAARASLWIERIRKALSVEGREPSGFGEIRGHSHFDIPRKQYLKDAVPGILWIL